MQAEQAYLFRHALLRDAAYQLQLPGDRSRLHGLAFDILESLSGGRPPDPRPVPEGNMTLEAHPSDPVASELAEHARCAGAAAGIRRIYLHRGAAIADRNYEGELAKRLWLELAGLVNGVEHAESLHRAGHACMSIGKPAEAEQLCDRALALFRAAGLPRFEAGVVGTLAVLYHDTGRFAEAESAGQAARALHRASGNKALEAVALGNLAGVYRDSGRAELAVECCRAALALHRAGGDRRSEGIILGNLANLVPAEEEALLAQAIAIHRETGNRRSESFCLGNLAALHFRSNRLDEAERLWSEALAIARDIGNLRLRGVMLGNMGLVYRSLRRPVPSAGCYREAIELLEETRDSRSLAIIESGYALLFAQQGRLEEARARWDRGMSVLRSLQDHRAIENALQDMRVVCAGAGVELLE